MAKGRLSKHERVALWRGRIARALDHQRVFYEGEGDGKPPGAQFAIECFRGNTKPAWWSEQDAWVHIGKLKAAVRAAIPSLMYANPRFRVYPSAKDILNGEDVAYARAKAKELWLNHVWEEANGQVHARVGIQNAFFTLGAVKAGYLCDFEDDEERGVWAKTEDGEYILDENGDPTLERGRFLKDENGDIQRDEYGIPVPHPGRLTKEKWFIEVIDPKMLLFDVESGPDYFQHRWIIERWIRPLAEVQADPRYSKAARERVCATQSVRGNTQRRSIFEDLGRLTGGEDAVVEQDEERVEGYDIYDFQNQRYMVIAESGSEVDDEFLLDSHMPAGLEQGPFRFLKYTEDVGAEWYPIPDAIDMALVNQEYDLTRSQMVIHREHTKTRYMELPGAFEGHEGADAEEEREKWSKGGDATLIKVKDANSILPAPKANLDGSFFSAIPNIAADFNEVGGMPGEVRGVADAESATQASILASGAEIRNTDRRDNQVQKWLCEIGRMLLMSGQANAELDTVVMDKIVDATGITPFRPVRLTPEELLGEFEVTVEIGSTMNKSDPRNLASLNNLIQALSQNPWIATVTGLTEYALESINLPRTIATQLAEAAQQATAQQNGAPSPTTQTLDEMVGGMPSMAGGASTGAPVN